MVRQVELDVASLVLNDVLQLHAVGRVLFVDLFYLAFERALSRLHLHEGNYAGEACCAEAAAVSKQLATWARVLSPDGVVEFLHHALVVLLTHVPSE